MPPLPPLKSPQKTATKANNISLRQIEAFKTMVETESVTAAARSMHVSQPSVSRLLRDLEYNVGFSLFERQRGRLLVTPEAMLLYEEVQKYFQNLQKVAHSAADIRALARGQLRLGSYIALSVTITPKIIKQFTELHPDIFISSTTAQSRQIVDLISSRFADLGIIDPVAITNMIRIERRLQFRCVCAIPAGHPLADKQNITTAQLAAHKVIGLEKDFLARQPNGAKLYETLAPHLRIQMHQSISACALVAEGVGVAIIDPFTAMFCAPLGIEIRRLAVQIPFEICVASSSEAPLSMAAKEFLALFDQEIKQACADTDYLEQCGRKSG